MKKANRSSKIINFKDFNTGYNAVSEREDNIIGKKIADFRAANKMSLTDLRILLEIYGISITNASISKWETGASVPNIYHERKMPRCTFPQRGILHPFPNLFMVSPRCPFRPLPSASDLPPEIPDWHPAQSTQGLPTRPF